MKNTIAILLILVVFMQVGNTQSPCGQISGIIGVWEEDFNLLSMLVAERKAYKFKKDNSVEIYQFNPNIGDYELLGIGNYKLDNPFNPTKITFSNLSILIFKTEGSITFPFVYLDDNVFEWEILPGLTLRMLRYLPLDFHVNITPVAQKNKQTCWAASATMMYSWATQQAYEISDALFAIEKGKGKYWHLNDESTDICILPWNGSSYGGLNTNDGYVFFTKIMGLQIKTIDEVNFEKNLPLLMVRPKEQDRNQLPNCPLYETGHVIVMTGVHGDGTPENTCFDIIDPWARDDNGNQITLEETQITFKDLFSCTWYLASY